MDADAKAYTRLTRRELTLKNNLASLPTLLNERSVINNVGSLQKRIDSEYVAKATQKAEDGETTLLKEYGVGPKSLRDDRESAEMEGDTSAQNAQQETEHGTSLQPIRGHKTHKRLGELPKSRSLAELRADTRIEYAVSLRREFGSLIDSMSHYKQDSTPASLQKMILFERTNRLFEEAKIPLRQGNPFPRNKMRTLEKQKGIRARCVEQVSNWQNYVEVTEEEPQETRRKKELTTPGAKGLQPSNNKPKKPPEPVSAEILTDYDLPTTTKKGLISEQSQAVFASTLGMFIGDMIKPGGRLQNDGLVSENDGKAMYTEPENPFEKAKILEKERVEAAELDEEGDESIDVLDEPAPMKKEALAALTEKLSEIRMQPSKSSAALARPAKASLASQATGVRTTYLYRNAPVMDVTRNALRPYRVPPHFLRYKSEQDPAPGSLRRWHSCGTFGIVADDLDQRLDAMLEVGAFAKRSSGADGNDAPIDDASPEAEQSEDEENLPVDKRRTSIEV